MKNRKNNYARVQIDATVRPVSAVSAATVVGISAATVVGISAATVVGISA